MENSGNEFDLYCSNELREPILFKKIVKSNIGWFSDKSICDHHVNYWGLENKYGLYILWHKSDYNPDSGLFHMKALYIGKGNIGARLRSHWKNKDFSDELLIYFTYVELPNRVSKYVEQLFLDIYKLPFNMAENTGTKELSEYFTQCEVD